MKSLSPLKDPLLSLRQFLATESTLIRVENVFYFILKALFILKIFNFYPDFFGHVGKRLDKVNFKKFVTS